MESGRPHQSKTACPNEFLQYAIYIPVYSWLGQKLDSCSVNEAEANQIYRFQINLAIILLA
jgi:hypothetical protein